MAKETKEPAKTKKAATTGAGKATTGEKPAATGAAVAAAGKPNASTNKTTAKKAKKRRNVPEGKAYIQASYNNTIVTITEPNGQVLVWGSAGSSGFKGTRKATPYAAQISAENTAEKAKVFGLERVHVYIKGVGAGREQAVRGLVSKGIDIISISDVTPVPHNGCRKRKARRV